MNIGQLNPSSERAHSSADRIPAKAAANTPPERAAMHWTDQLRDGTHVLVRPICKDDAALERAFIGSPSEQSRRQRFLGQLHEASDSLIKQLTEVDFSRDMAFVALVHHDGQKRIVGVSRYASDPAGTRCECAVAVTDDWQNRGLGSLLMRHLMETARSQGFREMLSIDSAANLQMRELAHALGFSAQSDPDDASQTLYRRVL